MDRNSARPSGPYAKPLASDETRTIILQPSAFLEDDIACEIETVSLENEDLPYEALSYTCGPPSAGYTSPDRSITVCGHMRAVGGNLWDALKRLRLPDRPRRLCVDALSINQEDNAERSQQVAITGRIYHHAWRVIA